MGKKYWNLILEESECPVSFSKILEGIIRIVVRCGCKIRRNTVFLLPLLIQKIPVSGQQTLSFLGYASLFTCLRSMNKGKSLAIMNVSAHLCKYT